MWTVATANEHHAETGRAGDRSEFRFAVTTRRRVGRNGGAAVRAIERLRFHQQHAPALRRHAQLNIPGSALGRKIRSAAALANERNRLVNERN